jgi:hypothetical protein
MTDRDIDATGTSEQERPESTKEAAEIVRNDPALAKATEHSPSSSSAQDSQSHASEEDSA